jgi:hypothetical protein
MERLACRRQVPRRFFVDFFDNRPVGDGQPGKLVEEPTEVFVVHFEAGERVRTVVEGDPDNQSGSVQEDVS